MEEFTQYFNEDLDGEEEGVYYERWVKNDLDTITLAFTSGMRNYHVFQEEEGLFQIKGQILDDGCARYAVNGRHSFDRRYRELTHDPSTAAEGFFPREHGFSVNQVNPENATEIEMYALCSDMDANGQGIGGKLSTWETLNYFRVNAGFHGYFEPSGQTDSHYSLRQNWLAMIIRMNADYEKAGLEGQAADGRMLIQMLGGNRNRIHVGKPHGGRNCIHGGKLPEEVTVNTVVEDGMLLTNEIRRCSYPSERGTGEEICYIVCYTRDGIFCKRAGDRRALWKMLYRNGRDYGRVMGFLRYFGSDENLRFAAHKNFWQDFLSGDLDVDGFLEFFARLDNGIPNYLIITGHGIYADREGLKFQKYFDCHSIEIQSHAETQSQMLDPGADLQGNSGEHLHWQENYQRWKREFVSLFEDVGRRRAG